MDIIIDITMDIFKDIIMDIHMDISMYYVTIVTIGRNDGQFRIARISSW